MRTKHFFVYTFIIHNLSGGKMKLTRSLLALALTFSLSLFSFLALPINTALAQDTAVALQRGYRTGYSDGYMAGYRDSIDSSAKNYSRHNEYSDAKRAYNKDFGALEDYQDGYRQGFESGYNTGFDKLSFDAAVPANLQKRGSIAENSPVEVPLPPVEAEVPQAAEPEPEVAEAARPQSEPSAFAGEVATETMQKVSFQPVSDAVIIIPRDTELIVELLEPLSTEKNREGDKFTARIVSPAEIAGAVIEGRVDKVQKPGRLKRRSAMQLSFDRIVLTENRWSNFDAILTEVLPVKGDNIKRVDNEGTAIGKSSLKDDSIKVGAATGAGAGIGALAGGPVGAAVGAGVGAAFGVGAVVIERGKHVKLNSAQQLRIKTSYETQIR